MLECDGLPRSDATHTIPLATAQRSRGGRGAVEGTREILQPLSDYSFGVSAPYTSASALSGSIPDTILALILMAFTALVAPV